MFAYVSGLGRHSRHHQILMIGQKKTKDLSDSDHLANNLLSRAEELQEVTALEGLIQTLESLTAKGERALRENRMDRFAQVN